MALQASRGADIEEYGLKQRIDSVELRIAAKGATGAPVSEQQVTNRITQGDT
jgi:hypothetical protein